MTTTSDASLKQTFDEEGEPHQKKFDHGFVERTIPETKPQRSVLQPWVQRISLREQGVLLGAIRGPDGVRKESKAKIILRNFRGCVMNSGREGKPMDLGTFYEGDTFMRTVEIYNPPCWFDCVDAFLRDIDEYNVHFFQHLLHAAAVVGVHHWNEIVRPGWWHLYVAGVKKLHMHPETKEEISHRLREGVRIEFGE